MPDPSASRLYRDDPGQLLGHDPGEVEKELDTTLVGLGGWIKSTSADGNGVRYIDGKGGLVIINRDYPGARLGPRDALQAGPM